LYNQLHVFKQPPLYLFNQVQPKAIHLRSHKHLLQRTKSSPTCQGHAAPKILKQSLTDHPIIYTTHPSDAIPPPSIINIKTKRLLFSSPIFQSEIHGRIRPTPTTRCNENVATVRIVYNAPFPSFFLNAKTVAQVLKDRNEIHKIVSNRRV